MLKSVRNLFYFLALTMTVSATASETKPEAQNDAQAVAQVTDQKKDHSFEDLLVQGKFHFADEAVSTVEGDKVLDALIGVRQDFKDRIEDSKTRY